MTTSVSAERAEILDRVRQAGWTVEQAPNGFYKVTSHTGAVLTVHTTVGDHRGIKNLQAELNRMGFAEVEEAANAERAKKRDAKLNADRKTNERRAAAIARAAGPYAPSPVKIGEILGTHPAPRVYHQVPITPDMAAAILERNGTHRPNRRIRSADITHWCKILRGGRWHYTHQGVAIDSLGQLQDGQHRLAAIVETGITADMMISVGMPPENFASIDTGRRRTAAQVIDMRGVPYSATVSGVVRLLHLHTVWGPLLLDHTNERVDNDEIAATYDDTDAGMLDRCVRWAHRLRAEIGAGPVGPAAAYYLICDAVGVDDPHVQGFGERLIRGSDLDDKAPLHVLRRSLTRQATGVARKLVPAESMALVVKGWNAHHQGKRTKLLVVREGASMPSVVIPRSDSK